MNKINATTAQILPEVETQIRKNKKLKLELCQLLDVSPATLQRYLDRKNPILIRIDAIRLIAQHLGVEPVDVTTMEYQEAI